jgi:GTP cyclohydrolase I
MVLVRDIEFYSLCEHHMLPFFGHILVAYIPDGKIVGLNKLPRLVDLYAQENSESVHKTPMGMRYTRLHCNCLRV